MKIDIVTFTVTCPRCGRVFREQTWQPLARALEEEDSSRPDELVFVTCPACGCTISMGIRARERGEGNGRGSKKGR